MPSSVFSVSQKFMSLGTDMSIDDAEGNKAYQVKGSMRASDPHTLMGLDGEPIYVVAQNFKAAGRVFEILRAGQLVASVKQAAFSFGSTKFIVTLADGERLDYAGNFGKREYKVSRAGVDLVVASRKLLSVRECYGVQVAPDFEAPLGLAIAIAIEQMERQV